MHELCNHGDVAASHVLTRESGHLEIGDAQLLEREALEEVCMSLRSGRARLPEQVRTRLLPTCRTFSPKKSAKKKQSFGDSASSSVAAAVQGVPPPEDPRTSIVCSASRSEIRTRGVFGGP